MASSSSHSKKSNKAPEAPTDSSGAMTAGHGQGGQGQGQGQIGGGGMSSSGGGMTSSSSGGDGPKSTPDIFQLRNFVSQPNS